MAKWGSNIMLHNIFKCFLIAVVFLAFANTEAFCNDQKGWNKNQSEQGKNDSPYLNRIMKPKFDPCKDIIIVIDGVKLAVPKVKNVSFSIEKATHEFSMTDEERISCKLLVIKNVGGLDLIPISVHEPAIVIRKNTGQLYNDNYSFFAQTMPQYLAGSKIHQKDGVIRIGERRAFFILPLDKAKTRNHQPVLIDCSLIDGMGKQYNFITCHTRYIHESGLAFSYSMYGHEWNEADDKILQIDQEQRAILEAMINKAKSVNINGKVEK
jgi:hypothetical protein